MQPRFEAKLCQQVRDETLYLRVQGEFTYVAGPWFDAVFADARDEIKRLVVDCGGMTQVDSTAMGILLYAQHQLGEGTVELRGVHGVVSEAIRRMGFDRLFVLT